jgi:hypothetical protein
MTYVNTRYSEKNGYIYEGLLEATGNRSMKEMVMWGV